MFRTNLGKARAKGIFRVYLSNMAAYLDEEALVDVTSQETARRRTLWWFVCSP